jgi:phosphatidylglycerophosphate synthase
VAVLAARRFTLKETHMFGIPWPAIVVFVFILIFFAVTGIAGWEAGQKAAAKAGYPKPSPLEKLAAVVLIGVIMVELGVLAVHGLHILADRGGGWLELMGAGFWIIGLASIPINLLIAFVLHIYVALAQAKNP